MSAFCDLALALGLTFGGSCVEHAPTLQPELPADDDAAWALPAPPPEPERPAMPPIVIRKEVHVPAPAPFVVPSEPEPAAPPPDPLADALTAAWMHPATPAPRWDGPVLGPAAWSASLENGVGAQESGAREDDPHIPAMPAGALDLASLAQEDYTGPRRDSTRPVDNARIVTADRYITGILETGINSQVGSDTPGSVIIQTARDVFGYHGRNVLIPKGSRLICSFEPPADIGSSRLPLACERILMAGHRAEIRELDAAAGNVQGQAGISGEVDRRFAERYGTAFMLTGISTAVRFGSALANTSGNDEDSSSDPAEAAAEELSTRFGEISASVLEQTLSLTPIITIPQGTRVQIRPALDWYIAKAE